MDASRRSRRAVAGWLHGWWIWAPGGGQQPPAEHRASRPGVIPDCPLYARPRLSDAMRFCGTGYWQVWLAVMMKKHRRGDVDVLCVMCFWWFEVPGCEAAREC